MALDFSAPGFDDYETLLAAADDSDPMVAIDMADPVNLIYSSGTTGTPKGVWSGLLDDEDARALLTEERDLWGFSDGDVNLVLSPLYHSAPLRFAMGTLLAGGRLVVPGPFDVEAVTAAIEQERPTTAFCVPTHLERLFRHWDAVGAPDVSCFRLLAHAGAPCPDDVKRRLLETFPPGRTWEFYGSTEGQFPPCRPDQANAQRDMKWPLVRLTRRIRAGLLHAQGVTPGFLVIAAFYGQYRGASLAVPVSKLP